MQGKEEVPTKPKLIGYRDRVFFDKSIVEEGRFELYVYVENTKRYQLSNKALGTIGIKSLKGKCVNKS